MYAISKKELEEWEKHPAKEFIGIPWNGIVEESLAPEALRLIQEERSASTRWAESPVADDLAKDVIEARQKMQVLLRNLVDTHNDAIWKEAQAVRDYWKKARDERARKEATSGSGSERKK